MQIPGAIDLPIKIGLATLVDVRIANLQTAHPYPLKLLTYFPAIRGGETERLIHSLFDDFRLKGEWFLYDATIVAFLDEQHRRFADALAHADIPPRYKTKAETQQQSLERQHKIKMNAREQFAEQGLVVTRLRVVDDLAIDDGHPTVIWHDIASPPLLLEKPLERPWKVQLREWYAANGWMVIGPDKIASLLGLPENDMRQHARKGTIPHCRIGARSYRWTVEQTIGTVEALGLDGSALHFYERELKR